MSEYIIQFDEFGEGLRNGEIMILDPSEVTDRPIYTF